MGRLHSFGIACFPASFSYVSKASSVRARGLLVTRYIATMVMLAGIGSVYPCIDGSSGSVKADDVMRPMLWRKPLSFFIQKFLVFLLCFFVVFSWFCLLF